MNKHICQRKYIAALFGHPCGIYKRFARRASRLLTAHAVRGAWSVQTLRQPARDGLTLVHHTSGAHPGLSVAGPSRVPR